MISDLAKRMIMLSGATHVEIKYTSLRDGEKLYEELLNKEENTKSSSHPKIKLAAVRELSYAEILEQVAEFVRIIKDGAQLYGYVKQMKVLCCLSLRVGIRNTKFGMLNACDSVINNDKTTTIQNIISCRKL